MSAGLEVVVLAAGRGSRLTESGEERPKWLLEVGDGTIADRQLAGVELARGEAAEAIADVHVVTGHAAGAIERYLDERGHDDVSTLHNPTFAELNNWFSVLVALRAFEARGGGRVAFLNSDLIAAPEWIASFLLAAATAEPEALIAVDLNRQLTDESMKVRVRGSAPAVVDAIGKVGVEDPAGEYVGMLMASGRVLDEFRRALESFVGDPGRADEWYERAVGITAADGVPWEVWGTPDSDWVEIDDDRDLEMAGRLRQLA